MTATTHPAPKDHLFGVCAALGEDFGFDPLWLRIGFAIALLFDLEHVLMAYAALGLLVLVSRLIVPSRRRGHAVEASTSAPVVDHAPLPAPEYRQAA
jgi:phage shock protein C